jgi:tRNA (pseudouridine54-N1)-methyltransferase
MPDSPLLRFIQLLPNVPSNGDFLLQDLPGSGKRIDVLCRDLSACFDWAPIFWNRDMLEVVAVLQDNMMITFRGLPAKKRGEVEWAVMIRDTLRGEEVDGLQLEKRPLDNLIQDLQETDSSEVYVLDETGNPLDKALNAKSSAQNSFMLGDHRGFDSRTEELIVEHKLTRVSLGERSYLSSHCIAAIIAYFERTCR